MKCYLFFSVTLAMILLGTSAPEKNHNRRLAAVAYAVANKDPYMKGGVCVNGAHVLENCTLCFCTDEKNLSFCWDYEGDKCQEIKKEVKKYTN